MVRSSQEADRIAVTWGRIQRLSLRLHDAVSIPSPRQQASLGHHNRMPGFWSRLLFSYGLHVCFSWFLLPASLGETPFYPKKLKGSYNGGVRLLLLQSSWKKAPAWGGGFNSTWMMTGFVLFFYHHATENRRLGIKQMQSQSQKGEHGRGLEQIYPGLPSL